LNKVIPSLLESGFPSLLEPGIPCERFAERTSEEVLKKGKKKGTVSRRELLKMSFIVRHRRLSVSISGSNGALG
jgi:hypothetical protein